MQIKIKRHRGLNSKKRSRKSGDSHHSSHHSSSHHSGSHHSSHSHGSRRIFGIKKRHLIYIARAAAALAGAAAVVSIAAAVVIWNGKSSLYKNASSDGPDLDLEEAGDGWEEGDIRYNGKVYRYNSDMLTFLFMGIDSNEMVEVKESGNEGGRADTLFLFCMNPHNEESYLIAINRNTMTDINIYGSNGAYLTTAVAQITLQHIYGDGAELSCERTVETVQKLFYDLPIHGYCAINMGGVPLLNDAVGGVEVVSLETFTGELSGTEFVEGETYLLVGSMAYDYVRSRDKDTFASADMRLARQKQYLISFAANAEAATKADLTLPVTMYSTLSKYMVTDLSVGQVTYLASQLISYSFDSDHMLTIGGETVMGDEYEEFYIDEDSLYDIIIQVFYEEVSED